MAYDDAIRFIASEDGHGVPFWTERYSVKSQLRGYRIADPSARGVLGVTAAGQVDCLARPGMDVSYCRGCATSQGLRVLAR